MNLHGHSDISATWYSLYHLGYGFALSPHFKLSEFASGDGADIVLVHPALLDGLEQLRGRFGLPIKIQSGYRTPSHNTVVGGAPRSKHLLGLAADVKIKGIDPDVVAEAARRLVFGGAGQYNSFTHVDVRQEIARWDERTPLMEALKGRIT